ncbi:hypothetical protein L1887_39217 [Cichorium endivia]|nr:hypothetical protein L1887_39217 [Cichorium endivia]
MYRSEKPCAGWMLCRGRGFDMAMIERLLARLLCNVRLRVAQEHLQHHRSFQTYYSAHSHQPPDSLLRPSSPAHAPPPPSLDSPSTPAPNSNPSPQTLQHPFHFPCTVNTIASTPQPPSLFTNAAAHSAPIHRVSYAFTLTATHPFVSRSRKKLGTTGGSSNPTTNGTGNNTPRPSPYPNDSTRPAGVGMSGTKTLILSLLLRILLTNKLSINSESFPRAQTVKTSPDGDNVVELSSDREKAEIPEREVKARAKN